ncbi:MAG TPA: ATP-binding cassette domain-containing protein [Acidimicrobiales bacterium]|jgi:energy-coupling factor transport system ATP-binding protein|nr:ATP-binding cassette domain-containing protein [Acidimicrobiales bacterium]
MAEEQSRASGPLRPIELATASVLAALAVVLTVVGWFLPHLTLIAAFAVVPLGVVSHHYRLRALLAATFAAILLSFLVAGTGAATNIVECSAVGGLVGTAKRRGWGLPGVAMGVAVIGPVLAGLSVGLLFLFSSLRKLTLQQVKNSWKTIKKLLSNLPGSSGLVHHLDSWVNRAITDWWATIAVLVILSTIWFSLLGWVFVGAVLERLQWIRAQDRLDPDDADQLRQPPGPVPATLEEVGYRYPHSDHDVLAGVDLTIADDEMVALVGDNGSGKSTLTRILAGRRPTVGRITRPGRAGLGMVGGTALIMQHPESQVLGVRVADDVVWGLAAGVEVDVDGLLGRVGLAGMGDRETSGLSGGELQRLAVAAALARRPALLLSDESTAMVDETGRRDLTELLRRLPSEGTAIVHVTHRPEEAEVADRRFRMTAGFLIPDAPAEAPPGHLPPPGPELDLEVREMREPERLIVQGVSHTYGIGTPWAGTALEDINLTVEPGEGVLVVGGNGSGKSTLAWIMAGLLRPTYGTCELDGQPMHTRIGAVGLAFQHARLQLQRATVGKDVRAAGAADDDEVGVALRSVGLNWPKFADQRIDALSGGQQRRVALAGILARRPSILVLDEPLAGLDHPSRDALIDLLAGLRRDQGMTVVVISHDLHGMERLCDRVVQLDAGRIVADAPREAAER